MVQNEEYTLDDMASHPHIEASQEVEGQKEGTIHFPLLKKLGFDSQVPLDLN